MNNVMTTTLPMGSNATDITLPSAKNGGSVEEDERFDVEDENLEEILMELATLERELSKASSMIDVTISPLLETYLKEIANGGTTQFPWNKIKSLFKVKLEKVIFEFNKSSPTSEIPPAPNVAPYNFDNIKSRVFSLLDSFIGIPFTVQRLAELITAPRKHYRRTDKFMRALEKNMQVVSTVEAREPLPSTPESIGEPSSSCASRSIINGNDHNVLPMSHLRRAQSPTSTGFVKSSPTKDSDLKNEGKEVEPSSPSNSDEDKENINEDGNIQEAESKKPDSSEPFIPCGSDAPQGSSAVKTSEADSESVAEADHQKCLKGDEPSTSEADASKSCDDSPINVSPEKGLASSSSDVAEEADDNGTKTPGDGHDNETSEVSVATSSVVDSQQEKPDEGEPNMDDGGPCDSAEDNHDVSSAENFKADEMQIETQVDSSETPSLTGSGSATKTKERSAQAQPSEDQPPPPAPSESNDPEVEKMDVDAECTSSDTLIHTSS